MESCSGNIFSIIYILHNVIMTERFSPNSTETRKLQTAMFLEESVYTYVTVELPAINASPEVCVLYNKIALPDSSVAYGSLHVMTSPCNPTSIVVEMSAGQLEMLGA